MQLQTPVTLPSYPFGLSHEDTLLFIGSCFAENIGNTFKGNKFDTLVNPFGILYNPTSVNQCLQSVLSNTFDDTQLVAHDGLWHSWAHHGSFSHQDKDICRQGIIDQLEIAHHHLLKTNYLFITFGTASLYENEGRGVANCHKFPAQTFTRRRLSVDEIVQNTRETIKALRQANPNLQVVFSISPVRYTKDGLHENSLNKATLLLAVEQLCNEEYCHYFPAYEIVIDELRDYRFFAEDMSHPSALAIAYLWEKIEHTFFDSTTLALNKRINKLIMASQHRPFNSQPQAHQQFLQSMLTKASDLQRTHPELDLEAEIAYFSQK